MTRNKTGLMWTYKNWLSKILPCFIFKSSINSFLKSFKHYLRFCFKVLNLAMSKLEACGMWTTKTFGRMRNSIPEASNSITWDTLFQPNPTNRLSCKTNSHGQHLWSIKPITANYRCEILDNSACPCVIFWQMHSK